MLQKDLCERVLSCTPHRLHMAASLVCKQWNYIIKATWFISSRRMWESAEVLALVIGGYSGAVSAQCEVLELSGTRGTATLMHPLRMPRRAHSCVVVHDTVLVLGGFDHSDHLSSLVEQFTLGSTGWRDGPSLMAPRGAHTSVVVNGMLLVAGGQCDVSVGHERPKVTESSELLLLAPNGGLGSSCTWQQGPSMMQARSAAASAVFDGAVVIAGGFMNDHRGDPALNSVEVWSPNDSCWHLLAPLIEARGDFALTVVRDRMFAIGGRPQIGGHASGSVEEFCASAGAWTSVGFLNVPRIAFCTVCVEETIFVLGGVGTSETDSGTVHLLLQKTPVESLNVEQGFHSGGCGEWKIEDGCEAPTSYLAHTAVVVVV